MTINGKALTVTLALIIAAVLGQERIPVLRSCSELKIAGYSNDGEYRIDPDGPGIGLPPFIVYCDMETNNTIIEHDQMVNTIVPQGFEGAGEFRVPVTYQDSVSIQQLTQLADLSSYCSQYISADCSGVAVMWGADLWSYWVSRDGTAMANWGTPTGTHGCQCSIDHSCPQAEHVTFCNCDTNDNTWRRDDGELTDKTTLPVTELRLGDTDGQGEKVVYKVGPLKCSGLDQEIFPSCSAWADAGYIGEGDYLIHPYGGPAQVRRCNEHYLPNPPPVLRSCEELRTAGYTANDMYWIDPDTTLVGLQPFLVFCDMTTGTTIVRNDRQGRLISNGFNDEGEHRMVVHYNDASIQQVSSLVDISDTCQQYMSKECHDSSTWYSNREYTWWISRNGTHMSNWGSPTGTEGCACSLTQSCDANGRCNCDSTKDLWEQDDGYITDKATLPIWEIRIGNTGSSNKIALYSVGELKCRGIGAKLYASCGDLVDAGFAGEGHYLIDPDSVDSEVPRVVKCNGHAAMECPKKPQNTQDTGSSQDSLATQAASTRLHPEKSQAEFLAIGQPKAVNFVVVGVIILIIAVIVLLIIAAMQWTKMKKLQSTINISNAYRETTINSSTGQYRKDVPGMSDSFSHIHFFNNSESAD